MLQGKHLAPEEGMKLSPTTSGYNSYDYTLIMAERVGLMKDNMSVFFIEWKH